jgi:NAD(P)-dependent dehydrogenase (short-subunit alcohol dehydrogenase family)
MTKDVFGTNHLGHFELTRLLQPQLEAATAARVINLSSDGHHLDDIHRTMPTGSGVRTTSSARTARRRRPTYCTPSS